MYVTKRQQFVNWCKGNMSKMIKYCNSFREPRQLGVIWVEVLHMLLSVYYSKTLLFYHFHNLVNRTTNRLQIISSKYKVPEGKKEERKEGKEYMGKVKRRKIRIPLSLLLCIVTIRSSTNINYWILFLIFSINSSKCLLTFG